MSPEMKTTTYPRMMEGVQGTEDEDEELPLPSLLRPDGITKEGLEERSRKFDSAFAPLADLSAEDVVVGCASHGNELVAQSKDHFSKFADHIRAVDTNHGAKGIISSLEAGQLVQLPVAATKVALGTGLYGVAAGARFGPKVLGFCKVKCEEWHLREKTEIAATYISAKARVSMKHTARGVAVGLEHTTRGVSVAWNWLKAKVVAFYTPNADPNPEDDEVDV